MALGFTVEIDLDDRAIEVFSVRVAGKEKHKKGKIVALCFI
jgi:hypothetical protein